MEMSPFDVVVVSAFGRGHWLAAEFQRERMRTLLIDVTPKLGVWPAEDGEGPFGVSRLDRFSESYLERLNHDDPVEPVENGWTLWLPEGPYEFKGPLTRFYAERLGLSNRWLEAMARGEALSSSEISNRPFSRSWPLALAHQIAATAYRPSALALAGGRPAPLAANFGVRFPSRQGLARNLEWLRERGVTSTDKTDILDVSFHTRRELSGLELRGEISGLVRGDFFVWTLTGGETAFLAPKLGEILYPGGVVPSEWCWLRYRFSVRVHPEILRMPLHTVLVDDIDAPWTHGNLLIVIKTPVEDRLDIWTRVPTIQRFNRDYLAEHGRRLAAILSKRLPLAEPEVQSLPQEGSYTSQQLGEPRVPIWDPARPPWKGRCSVANLSFESPENRENHTLDSEFDHQRILRDRVVAGWVLKQQKAEKEKKK